MSTSDSKLPRAAEALLSDWPVPERDWAAQLSSIQSRTQATDTLSPDPAAFAAPRLTAEPGEPSAAARPELSPAERARTLTDLARSALQKQREHTAPSEPRHDLLVSSGTVKPSAAFPGLFAAPTPAASAQSDVPVPAPAPAPSPRGLRSRERLLWGGAVLAVAAAAWLWRQPPARHAELPAIAQGVSASSAPATRAPAELAESPPSEPAARTKGVVEPRELATETPAPPARPPTAPADTAQPAQVAAARALGAKAAAALGGSASVAPERVVLNDAPRAAASAPSGGAAPSATEAAVAATPAHAAAEPSLRPADGTAEHPPAKPSTGAVQAALGAVLGGARRCLAGTDQPVSAILSFGSDGRVQTVTLSGATGAAGECIRERLSHARLAPFAEPSFSVSVAVRPI